MRSSGYSFFFLSFFFSFALHWGPFCILPVYLGLPLGALLLMNIFAFIHKKKRLRTRIQSRIVLAFFPVFAESIRTLVKSLIFINI